MRVCVVVEKYAERDPEEEIFRAFSLFDHDNTGRISLRVCPCLFCEMSVCHVQPTMWIEHEEDSEGVGGELERGGVAVHDRRV